MTFTINRGFYPVNHYILKIQIHAETSSKKTMDFAADLKGCRFASSHFRKLINNIFLLIRFAAEVGNRG